MKNDKQLLTVFGFSLLEVLVVLVIMSIFLCMSFPELKYFFDATEDTILQSQLLRTLQQAKQAAWDRMQPIALCHSQDHHTCSGHWIDGQLLFVNEDEDGVIKEPNQILAVVQSPVQHGILHFRAFPYYRDYLLFLPTEWTSHDNGTFWYCHAKKEAPVWAMMLSRAGKIRIQYPDQEGKIKDARGIPLTCE
jgi:prepilin-type N-terminal cleavage/methylation domain-containing protein